MEFNITHLILNAGPVVKLVMLILLIFSIVSWGIIFNKRSLLKKTLAKSNDFSKYFWDGPSLDAAYKKAHQLSHSATAALYMQSYTEYKKLQQSYGEQKMHALPFSEIRESLERSIEKSISQQTGDLAKRLSFLATTANSAPFIGLFGTVWGIMNSFLNIGAKGATNLAVVAPGISEALIATALGLFAAIPAAIGYNYCNTLLAEIKRSMQHFGLDFLNALKRAKVQE
ncbi:MAG TPA: protein TolQ [Oligoflexia bacterium]|nr:protein TolQ [Oligoflexia bacterium]HMR24587.1 protein TolQ [Oligoflexia bacterium]